MVTPSNKPFFVQAQEVITVVRQQGDLSLGGVPQLFCIGTPEHSCFSCRQGLVAPGAHDLCDNDRNILIQVEANEEALSHTPTARRS